MSLIDSNIDSAKRDEMLALKLRERDVLLRRQALVKSHGISFYQPHRKQDAFHRAGRFKRRACFAGNRFGKSNMGAAEDVAQVLGYRPWMQKTDPAYRLGIPDRPQKVLVITTDWGKVDSVFTSMRGNGGKLWRMFPQGFVKSHKTNHSGAIELFEFTNGATMTFDTVESYKKNPQSAESDDWDVIHVDEPCPNKMFSAHARGLTDRNGQAYFTLTPLREPWIYDYFYGEDCDASSMVENDLPNVSANDRWSVTGSIWDNPYLTKEAIDAFLADCDPDERECRESGVPLAFAGLIYKDFDPSVHVYHDLPIGWAAHHLPPRDYTVYYHIDPHPQTPTAVLFCAVSPLGRRYLFDEIFERDTVVGITKRIQAVASPYFVARARIDPLAYNEDELSGTCWADDFAQNGLYLERAVKDLERGLARGKAAWRERDVNGLPVWMISPRLSRFLWEIRRYAWSDKPNKPVDKDDHMMENFYRTVLDEPTYVPFDGDRREIRDIAVTEQFLSSDRDDASLDTF